MTQYAYPDSDVSDGSWVNESDSGENLYASIDNTQPLDSGNDSDFVYSSDQSYSADSMIVGLSNVTDPSRAKGDPGGGFAIPNLTVALLETSTQRATVTITPTVGYADYSFTLTTAEANAIGNYNNLRLKFTRAAADGMWEQGYVSQAYFECPDASAPSATATPAAFLLFVD